jgi:hypothetical protein
MDSRKLARQREPAALPSESDLVWQELMAAFEDASSEVLACLHTHQTEGTQKALDALIRAQLRRSQALSDMLQFLDTLDETVRRST